MRLDSPFSGIPRLMQLQGYQPTSQMAKTRLVPPPGQRHSERASSNAAFAVSTLLVTTAPLLLMKELQLTLPIRTQSQDLIPPTLLGSGIPTMFWDSAGIQEATLNPMELLRELRTTLLMLQALAPMNFSKLLSLTASILSMSKRSIGLEMNPLQ